MYERVGIIQSNFIPWIGYFDFIKSCDLFIVYDDVQYTTADWRNRNRIKTPNGPKWISVPVVFTRNSPTDIDQTPINYSIAWKDEHHKWLEICYKQAPYYKEVSDGYFNIINKDFPTISALNSRLIEWVMKWLAISTPLEYSRKLNVAGAKDDKIINLALRVGTKNYVSGPNGKNYLQISNFQSHGMGLVYKSYEYPPYSQLHGAFIAGLSILDLLFNCGPESQKYITSLAPDEVACEPSIFEAKGLPELQK